MAVDDPRIRYLVGDYRVVAPNAKQKGDRIFLNGHLVVEKKTKDALGGEAWTHVFTVTPPSKSTEGDATLEQERQEKLAIWALLSAGAE